MPHLGGGRRAAARRGAPRIRTPVLERLVVNAPKNLIVGVNAFATVDAVMNGNAAVGVIGDTPVPNISVTWSSTDTGVATIHSSTGEVTPVAAGSTTIRATALGITGSDTCTVVTPTPTLTSLTIAPDPVSVTVGQTAVLSATALWSDASTNLPPLTWSKLSGVGSIDSGTGVYTAPASPGSAVIQVASGAVTDTVTVTVVAATPTLTSLTVVPDAPTLEINQSQQFAVTAVWSDGTTTVPTVAWSIVSGSGVIDSNGLFQAGSGAGSVTVRATSGSVSDTTTVTVNTPPPPPVTLQTLTLSPATATLQPSQTQQFVTTASWTDGSTVLPSPLAYSITSGGGTITSAGLYTAPPTPGAAVVRVESGAVFDTSAVTINVAGAAVPFHAWNPADYADNQALITAMKGTGPHSQNISGVNTGAQIYDPNILSQAEQGQFLEADALFGKRVGLIQIGEDRHCPANGGVVYPWGGGSLCSRNLSGSGPMERMTFTFQSSGVACYLNPFWYDCYVMFPDQTDVPSGNSVGYSGWRAWGQPGLSSEHKLVAGQWQGGSRLFRIVINGGGFRPDFHSADLNESLSDTALWNRTTLFSNPNPLGFGGTMVSMPHPMNASGAPKNGWWRIQMMYHRIDANSFRMGCRLRNSHQKDGTSLSLAASPWYGTFSHHDRVGSVKTLRLGINSMRLVESMNAGPVYTQYLRAGPQTFYGGINGGTTDADPLGWYTDLGLTPP